LRQIEAEVNIARIRVERLLRGLDYEHPNEFATYEVGPDGTPEQIARMVRAGWRLPAGPLRNLTQTIESAGGIVLLYPFSEKRVDGLSFWVTPTPPLFFLNDRATGDRGRWTLAHELGHIVMHRHVHPHIEDEADRFASELLMPGADIRSELHALTLAKAAALKMTWHVSIQALVRRARDLGVIPVQKYKSLCVQISRAGMRTNEPNPIEPEQPKNLASILKVHRVYHGYDLNDISRLALSTPDEFKRFFSPSRPKLRIAQ
jgi:Zn-dependent peptidase ImmA (M78 family)